MPIIIACSEMLTPPSSTATSNFNTRICNAIFYMGGRETLMHDQLKAVIVRPTCSLCLGDGEAEGPAHYILAFFTVRTPDR